jgi:hypothetical protein
LTLTKKIDGIKWLSTEKQKTLLLDYEFISYVLHVAYTSAFLLRACQGIFH